MEYLVEKNPPSYLRGSGVSEGSSGAGSSAQSGTFTAVAKVRGKEYVGVAKSAQAAKHRAAAKALDEFKKLPEEEIQRTATVPLDNPDALGGEGKSPISQIYELALKRDFAPVLKFSVKLVHLI